MNFFPFRPLWFVLLLVSNLWTPALMASEEAVPPGLGQKGMTDVRLLTDLLEQAIVQRDVENQWEIAGKLGFLILTGRLNDDLLSYKGEPILENDRRDYGFGGKATPKQTELYYKALSLIGRVRSDKPPLTQESIAPKRLDEYFDEKILEAFHTNIKKLITPDFACIG